MTSIPDIKARLDAATRINCYQLETLRARLCNALPKMWVSITTKNLQGLLQDHARLMAAPSDIRKLLDDLEGAKMLCEMYYNIAAGVLGEDEVRRQRELAIAQLTEAAQAAKPQQGGE